MKTVGSADHRVAELVYEDRNEHDPDPKKDEADIIGAQPEEHREDEERRMDLDGKTSEPEAHVPRLLRRCLLRERVYSDRLR